MPSQTKERGLYRELMTGAWELTWHRREFWVLGLFAAFLGNGGAINFILRSVSDISSGVPVLGVLSYVRAVANVLTSGTTLERATLILTILLLTGGAVLVALLSISSAGGVLYAAGKRIAKKQVTPREAFAVGMSRFWPLFLITALSRAMLWILYLAAVAAFLGSGLVNPLFGPLYFFLFIAFVVGTLLTWFISSIASAAISIDNDSPMDAVKRAWVLLNRHWLISLEMIALLFLVSIAAFAALFVAILIATIPFFLLFLAASILGSFVGFILVAAAGIIGLIVLIAITGSALAVFEQSAWALLYVRLSERGAIAKLERLYAWVRTRKRKN